MLGNICCIFVQFIMLILSFIFNFSFSPIKIWDICVGVQHLCQCLNPSGCVIKSMAPYQIIRAMLGEKEPSGSLLSANGII